MGRKSLLSEKQWKEIGDALLKGGESTRAIAKRYGISETAIRKRFPSRREDVKSVANQIVRTEEALEALPIGSQMDALTLARELREVSRHLVSAAKYGAATAHRLLAIGNAKVQEIDDANPLNLASLKAFKSIGLLTGVANESAKIGLNLLAANKDMARNPDETPPAPVQIVIESVDASADPTEA